jgi:hypothetical protein
MEEHTMKQPYESDYIRKDVLKMRTYQQQGHVLVTTHKHHWPLPCVHDVPGLQREGRGYNSPWGRFEVLYDLYEVAVFQPADGKHPPVWEEHDLSAVIEPATAIVDPARRWARIVADETEEELAILTDVDVSESGWRLLEEFRRLLAEHRLPAVVWRVEWAEPEDGEQPLWEGRAPLIRNEHAAVNLAGYAFDNDYNLIYLSAVGHKTALEAIRASLLGRHRKGKLILGGRQPLNGLERYEQAWSPIPDFQAHHVIFVARQALKPEPTDDATYLLVFDGEAETEAKRLLTKRLHEALPIPVLDEWAEALWNAADDRGWISEVRAAGDCRGCWQVSLMTDWAELVEALITQGEIKIAIE